MKPYAEHLLETMRTLSVHPDLSGVFHTDRVQWAQDCRRYATVLLRTWKEELELVAETADGRFVDPVAHGTNDTGKRLVQDVHGHWAALSPDMDDATWDMIVAATPDKGRVDL